MAARPLVFYPDPLLRRKAEPVAAFDEALRALAGDLVDCLKALSAIGITAPHLGILQRVTAIRLDAAAEPRLYVNPRIVWSSAHTARHMEGSVSMPGVTEEIERPAQVRVAYQDLAGAAHEEEAGAFAAACLQHEIDQLDGIFWIDRLSRLKRDRAVKRYEKLRRGGEAGSRG